MRRISTLGRPAARQPASAPERELIEAVSATAELGGHPLSTAAALQLADDLASLPRAAVLDALACCRAELRGRLSIGEILVRIDDGRPSAEVAWKMLPVTEAASVVWTREMAQAWSKVLPLLQNGEHAVAQRIFHDSYTHAVLIARCRQEKVCWSPSLGTDPVQREQVLLEAVQLERLSSSYVKQLLPYRALTLPAWQVVLQMRLKSFPE
ncbi:hypothetical protein [Noviherbaspirillum sedimenti]|uniref:Uncharacterized protein n=1 Tax=Noviherbaspirillum sedimenti TaxID=2320865 RepID=A0A3A3GKU7_9BURK|nr:hypothetical protein [Noviherbaspirillum sedimenti]RJG01590.1 hypothetical protein D3878_08325 [Noviherbaspirillum sedimenti]